MRGGFERLGDVLRRIRIGRTMYALLSTSAGSLLLACALAGIVAALPFHPGGEEPPSPYLRVVAGITWTTYAAVLLAQLALDVLRLHDIGWPWWPAIVPRGATVLAAAFDVFDGPAVLGVIAWTLLLVAWPGQRRPNRHGPRPSAWWRFGGTFAARPGA